MSDDAEELAIGHAEPLPRQAPLRQSVPASRGPSRRRGLAGRGVLQRGWSYAWNVARSGEGTVRNLAYVSLMKLFKLPSQD